MRCVMGNQCECMFIDKDNRFYLNFEQVMLEYMNTLA